MGLHEYRGRRDFRRTSEPRGHAGRGAGASSKPIFVVQLHDAGSRHFDLRLEVGGVLKSWAIPKGPSTDPRQKRLAVETEDHPRGYASFEGVIPEGEHGAGTVVVWDRGTYENRTTDDGGEPVPIERALADGHADVWLEGEKLHGGFALVHAKPGGEEENWLLVKARDEGADARRRPASTQPESVLSGRTNEELAEEEADDAGKDGD